MRAQLRVLSVALVILVAAFAAGCRQDPISSPTATESSRPDSSRTPTIASAPSWCWSWKFPFCGSWQVSCKYGCYLHTGNDYYSIDWNLPGESDFGQLVVAPAAGWQVWSGYNGGYGNSVVVVSGSSTVYRVAHLNTLRYPYQTRYVQQGEILGTCGRSGSAQGSHIHFSVHYPASYAGSGRINGPSVPQEGISGQSVLSTGSYYPSGQACQSR